MLEISLLNPNRSRYLSRSWLSNIRELLHGKVKLTHVPALRTQSGHWINDSRSKAELFRTMWQAKMTLPPEHPDAFFFAAAASLYGQADFFENRMIFAEYPLVGQL